MNGYWELFRATGAPVFYLLYRKEDEMLSSVRTAWKGEAAVEV